MPPPPSHPSPESRAGGAADTTPIIASNYFEIDIGNDLKLNVKKTPKVIAQPKLKNSITKIIRAMTENLSLDVKNALVQNHGEYWHPYLLIFHCDPWFYYTNIYNRDNYEYLTDLEPYSHLKGQNTIDDREGGYDNLLGVVSTTTPVVSTCDDDILCTDLQHRERPAEESVLVHEFAHYIFASAGRVGLPGPFQEIQTAFDNYKTSQSCKNKEMYSCVSAQEMWAESSQTWFGVNRRTDVNQGINTKENIQKNVPLLYRILKKVYGAPRTICDMLNNECKSECIDWQPPTTTLPLKAEDDDGEGFSSTLKSLLSILIGTVIVLIVGFALFFIVYLKYRPDWLRTQLNDTLLMELVDKRWSGAQNTPAAPQIT
tara:strand:- start:4 stop:1119 length:1116 start_codon:yes stop_codon:yes gene_type:complete